MLAFCFDDHGQIVDQWLGSHFVEMFAQLGWGYAPLEGSRQNRPSGAAQTCRCAVSADAKRPQNARPRNAVLGFGRIGVGR